LQHRLNRTILTAAAILLAASAASAQQTNSARLLGHPNLNGIWQPLNTAYWNLEAHSIEPMPKGAWQFGALNVIPAGKGVIKGGGKIPYLPEALKQRDDNRSHWPENDPEAMCFMVGIPRATYMGMPFQIFQGNGDPLMVYPFAAMHRVIHMTDHSEAPVDSWMGKSDGTWNGDTLVVTTTAENGKSWLDRAGNFASNQLKVTERFKLTDATHMSYEATMEDAKTFSQPWTIEMTLYKVIDAGAELMEHKCQPYADQLRYHDLLNP